MARLYADNIATTLAAGINNSTTTITVADATGLPSPTGGDFAILTLIEGTTTEKVKLTARSGTTLTVERGAESSTAASFTTAAKVILAATASSFTVGGATTQVLFNDAGDVAGDAGLTYNKTTNVLTNTDGQLVLTGGTVTTSTPLIDATQTWNAAATTFTGLKLNVTNTASSGASRVCDLQVGGSSIFSISPTGALTFANNTSHGNGEGVNYRGFSIDGDAFILTGRLNTTLKVGGNVGVQVTSNFLSFGSGTDTVLQKDADYTLALRRDTNPQTFRVYNTWSSSGTNHERGRFAWVSNVLTIGTEKGGTGVARAMALQTDGTTALTLTTAQKAEFAATIKTAAPTGGTAAEWKLGTVATVSPTSPNRTIEVEIGGTTYYLAAKTTND